MSSGCFIGRGSLLVAVLGASGGFFTLSGESEISVDFREDNESVNDARNGINERVDWYVRNYQVSLLAECFRIEAQAIELLLKSVYTQRGVNAAAVLLPNPIELGRDYFLRPNITPGTVVVTNAIAGVVPSAAYTVDNLYGLINFNATISIQPYTVALSSAGHADFALNGRNQVFVQAIFKGFDKASNRNVMAHFYRLALDVSEELKLVQKAFSGMRVRMQATPDVSAPLDSTLGQYGRIMLL